MHVTLDTSSLLNVTMEETSVLDHSSSLTVCPSGSYSQLQLSSTPPTKSENTMPKATPSTICAISPKMRGCPGPLSSTFRSLPFSPKFELYHDEPIYENLPLPADKCGTSCLCDQPEESTDDDLDMTCGGQQVMVECEVYPDPEEQLVTPLTKFIKRTVNHELDDSYVQLSTDPRKRHVPQFSSPHHPSVRFSSDLTGSTVPPTPPTTPRKRFSSGCESAYISATSSLSRDKTGLHKSGICNSDSCYSDGNHGSRMTERPRCPGKEPAARSRQDYRKHLLKSTGSKQVPFKHLLKQSLLASKHPHLTSPPCRHHSFTSDATDFMHKPLNPPAITARYSKKYRSSISRKLKHVRKTIAHSSSNSSRSTSLRVLAIV